jgi:4-amino-4-deoxy-L-arabinose transferase-like glycosyltransferase
METATRRRNTLRLAGLLVLLAGLLSNALFFVSIPGQRFAPWLNLALTALAAILLIAALRRAIAQPEVYGGKVAGWTLTIVSVLLFGLAIVGFRVSRDIPASAGAPRVGQKAPDFVLADTGGQTFSLSQLLASSNGASAQPKGVLLVFYRGYW